MKALFAHRRQAPRAALIYIAATADALPNQLHEQLRRTERYMWVLVAWPGVAVRPNASDNAEPSGASHCDPPKRTKKKPSRRSRAFILPQRRASARSAPRCDASYSEWSFAVRRRNERADRTAQVGRHHTRKGAQNGERRCIA